MPYAAEPRDKTRKPPSIYHLTKPLGKALEKVTPLISRSNRDLKMTLEDQLNALIFSHLEEHTSGRHLVQVLNEDRFAREHIAPKEGIEKSAFFEAINSRGLLQLMEVFEILHADAAKILPNNYSELGEIRVIDGSLIDAVLSMY